MMKEAYMRPQDIVILLKIDEKKGVIMGTNGTFNNTRAHIWLKGLNKKYSRSGLDYPHKDMINIYTSILNDLLKTLKSRMYVRESRVFSNYPKVYS